VHVAAPLLERVEDEHDGEFGPVRVQATEPVGVSAAPGPATVAVKVSKPPADTLEELSVTITVGVSRTVVEL
jgi:hypothetical protein